MLFRSYVDNIATISLSEDGQNWYNVPFAFLTEVTQFINQQKGFKPQPQPSSLKRALRTQMLPTNEPGQIAVVSQEEEHPASGLPIPLIQRKIDSNGTLEPMEVADIDPLESFAGLNALVAKNSVSKPMTARKARQKEAETEVINRPVIRGVDEATSKLLRGGGNAAKAVKPQHQ